jgi:elongation factor Ts
MVEIDAKTVMKLRGESGAPMMDCKRALSEAGGNWDRAKELLRIWGKQQADQRAARATTEGRVFSYVHAGDRIGVLLEIDCETDFVARNAEFVTFGHELCLHIAFRRPPYLTREQVATEEVERERSVVVQQVQEQMKGKPAPIQEKAVEGRMAQFFERMCLLDQKYVKDESKTIEDYRKEMVAKIGENLVVKRFAVFAVGEG